MSTKYFRLLCIAMFQIEEYCHEPMSYFFFYNLIPEKYCKYFEQSISLLKLRNTMIVLGYLEMASALLGFSYYFISTNKMHIVISLCAFFLSIAGVAFFVFINEIGIIFYSLLTICIPGVFFIHQLFNLAFSEGNLNNTSLLGIFTLPYIFDIICGFISIFYLRKISETNDVIMRLLVAKDEEKHLLAHDTANGNSNDNKSNIKYSKDFLKSEFNNRSALKLNKSEEGQINLLCVICCENPRQVLIEPCRHLLLCEQCMNKITKVKAKSKSNLTCPNCSRQIDYFAKIYI